MGTDFKKHFQVTIDELTILIKRWDIWESTHLDGIDEQAVKKCRLEIENIVRQGERILNGDKYGGTALSSSKE